MLTLLTAPQGRKSVTSKVNPDTRKAVTSYMKQSSLTTR